jgi:hypothetical protein
MSKEEKIKFNTQICTTKEQSKRLLELGLDADTSDMCWLAKKLWGDDVEIPEEDRSYILSTDKDDSFCSRYDVDCVPSWSLHRLIAMLPLEIEDDYSTESFLKIEGSNIMYKEKGIFIYNSFEKDNIYDNIIDCIEWLIQDVYFNKEYLKEE